MIKFISTAALIGLTIFGYIMAMAFALTQLNPIVFLALVCVIYGVLIALPFNI
jgi:hypothetical protein